jgi:hypothetical protein
MYQIAEALELVNTNALGGGLRTYVLFLVGFGLALGVAFALEYIRHYLGALKYWAWNSYQEYQQTRDWQAVVSLDRQYIEAGGVDWEYCAPDFEEYMDDSLDWDPAAYVAYLNMVDDIVHVEWEEEEFSELDELFAQIEEELRMAEAEAEVEEEMELDELWARIYGVSDEETEKMYVPAMEWEVIDEEEAEKTDVSALWAFMYPELKQTIRHEADYISFT